MKLRIISPTFHGVIDYSAGAGLIALPFLLKLGDSNPAALWISVVTGLAVFLVSVLTNYKYALLRTIPFDGHLAIDLTVASAFMAIPFALHFEGIDAYYYWINAAVVYLVVALTESDLTNNN